MSLLNGIFPIATDSEGRTLPKALLYSYEAGTNTPKDTYSDNGLITPNANPLEADGSGWFENLYLGTGGYKLVLTDRNGVVIKEQDNFYPGASTSDISNLQTQIDAISSETASSMAVYTDSGAADAYVLTIIGTLDPPTAYAAPMQIIFKPANANTGASTVNVESLGLKNLKDQSGSALTSGFLEVGKYFCFIYESGEFRYLWRSGLVSVKAIATDAVETAKIKDKNVTLAKIADDSPFALLSYDSGGVATTVDNYMIRLTQGNISASASISAVLSTLDTETQSPNNTYLIRIVGFQPNTDDRNLYLRWSSDAGSTWKATNYQAITNGMDSSGTARTVGSAAATEVTVGGSPDAGKSLSNAANELAVLEINLSKVNTGSSVIPFASWVLSYYNADGAITYQSGTASNTDAADYDAIEFVWEGGGNYVATGYYEVYKTYH